MAQFELELIRTFLFQHRRRSIFRILILFQPYFQLFRNYTGIIIENFVVLLLEFFLEVTQIGGSGLGVLDCGLSAHFFQFSIVVNNTSDIGSPSRIIVLEFLDLVVFIFPKVDDIVLKLVFGPLK